MSPYHPHPNAPPGDPQRIYFETLKRVFGQYRRHWWKWNFSANWRKQALIEAATQANDAREQAEHRKRLMEE